MTSAKFTRLGGGEGEGEGGERYGTLLGGGEEWLKVCNMNGKTGNYETLLSK